MPIHDTDIWHLGGGLEGAARWESAACPHSSPAEAKQMQDARRAEAAWRRVRACLCVPLCLHTRPAGTLPGGYRVKREAAKTRASEPAGASSCGVLKNQAVHSPPETGLYKPFLSLTLDTGLQAMDRPEVCSPTDEQIFLL